MRSNGYVLVCHRARPASRHLLAKARHGARVILMVVQQTYGGFLNFYPHLHLLVSAGGLDKTRLRWMHELELTSKEHRYELMLAWCFALLGVS
jgi:Putative transposase